MSAAAGAAASPPMLPQSYPQLMSPGASRHATLSEPRHFTLLRLVRKFARRDWVLLYESLSTEMAVASGRLGDWLLAQHAAQCGGTEGDSSLALVAGLMAAWRCFSNWWFGAVEQFTDEIDNCIELEEGVKCGVNGSGCSGSGGAAAAAAAAAAAGGAEAATAATIAAAVAGNVAVQQHGDGGEGVLLYRGGGGGGSSSSSSSSSSCRRRKRAQDYLERIDRDSGRDRDAAPHTPFLGDKARLAFRTHLLLRLDIWRPLRAAIRRMTAAPPSRTARRLGTQLFALFEEIDVPDDHKADEPLNQGVFRATLLQPAAQFVERL